MFIEITTKSDNNKMIINTDIVKYITEQSDGNGSVVHCFEHNDRVTGEYRLHVFEKFQDLKNKILPN